MADFELSDGIRKSERKIEYAGYISQMNLYRSNSPESSFKLM